LGDLKESIFNFITQTWVPRGIETASLIYGAQSGWVTHDETNIFGHTGYDGRFTDLSFKILLTTIG
jgi:alpha-L-fucosidase 2